MLQLVTLKLPVGTPDAHRSSLKSCFKQRIFNGQVLLTTYKGIFTNPNAASHELGLAVEGFGALAGLKGQLIQDEDAVAFMFQVILQRANSDFVRSVSRYSCVQPNLIK